MKKCLILLLLSFSIFTHAQNRSKVGICLSGGAALGYAHIGVLQALEENGIKPDIISASSMGAIIGALYSQGMSPQELLATIKEEKMNKTSHLLHFRNAKNGISSHKPLRKLLKEFLPINSFDSLAIPLHVCVSNISNAKWQIVSSGGNLHDYIVASASIPGVFEPVHMGDSVFVDGGLYNNLPSQTLKGKCDYIIGVDVLPYIEAKEVESTRDVITLSIRGLAHNNSIQGRKLCDFLIEPSAVKEYNEFDFKMYKEIYDNGYNTTIEYIAQHPEILKLSRIVLAEE